MAHRTDQALAQHPPGLPEPSYASRTLTTIAELVDLARPDSLIGELGLRRLFTVAVATELHDLPTNVADEVSAKVDGLLPPLAPESTCGPYAQQLRQLAEAV